MWLSIVAGCFAGVVAAVTAFSYASAYLLNRRIARKYGSARQCIQRSTARSWMWFAAFDAHAIVFALSFLLTVLCRTASWLSTLQRLPPSGQTSPWFQKRILVIVNPVGGTQRSRGLLASLVRPVLRAHQCVVTVLETTRAGHAAEYLQSADLSQFDLLLMLSGDGLLNEALNALVACEARRSPELTQDPTSPAYHAALRRALHVLPVALLPGGTSNGLVASLFGPLADVVDVLQRVMQSEARDADIMSVQSPASAADSVATDYSRTVSERMQKSGERPAIHVDMLCALYGIIGDNDDYAERRFRCLPYILRTTLSPLMAIAVCPSQGYGATIRFKPAAAPAGSSPEFESRLPFSKLSGLASWSEDPSWKVISAAQWMSLVVLNNAHPASDVLMAPGAEPDDGALYLSAVRGPMSKLKLLYLFTLMGDGSHNARPECDYFRISDIVVHPNSDASHMVISGEILPVRSIAIRVQHKAAYFVY